MSQTINRKLYFILSLLLLFACGFLGVMKASAYFAGEQNSSGNTFSAGTLILSLNNPGNFLSGSLYPGDSANTTVSISNTGTLDSQYVATSAPAGIDTAVCDYITMTATNGTFSYTGLIKNFISPAAITTDTTWNFSFTVEPNTPASVWNRTCFFRWTFTAWQNSLPNPSGGFVSVKEKLGSIQVGKPVVLNEFITNPAGPDDAPMPGGEWVELFNNSGNALDVSSLVLYDGNDTHKLFITASNTNTHGTTIAPHGFLVVYRNGDANFNLNDAAGSVRLTTGFPFASSTLLDSFTYTIEKPEGFSFARFPDGIGDWIDPIPTPGEPNNPGDGQNPNLPAENISNNLSHNTETPPEALNFLPGGDIGAHGATDDPKALPVPDEVVAETPPPAPEDETATKTPLTAPEVAQVDTPNAPETILTEPADVNSPESPD